MSLSRVVIIAAAVLLLPAVVLGSWRGIDRHWRAYSASLLLLIAVSLILLGVGSG